MSMNYISFHELTFSINRHAIEDENIENGVLPQGSGAPPIGRGHISRTDGILYA